GLLRAPLARLLGREVRARRDAGRPARAAGRARARSRLGAHRGRPRGAARAPRGRSARARRDPLDRGRASARGRPSETLARRLALAHSTDKDSEGSAQGAERGGLPELGRRTLARMEELGVAVDVAHLAPAAIDGVLAIAHKPVVVSHGGLKGTCDNARTISD